MPSCAACGTDNPTEAKFCASCGGALAAACPRCGHQNDNAPRFCRERGGLLATAGLEPSFSTPASCTPEKLADKIREGRRELEGERKQITVLFADVAGFTRRLISASFG